MKKKNGIRDDFTSKLKTGLTLSFERLLKSKQQSNAVLAFSEKGKVVKIKARDIKLSFLQNKKQNKIWQKLK